MSKLSVALCTYNGANYVRAQLQSIAIQTRPPDELVVIDDCSTDSTLEIIQRFAAQARFPVRLFVNERNVGSTKNFERAISHCEGDIIALSDQDDVWLPHKLLTFEQALNNADNVGLVFSDAELTDENLCPLGRRLWEVTFSLADQKKFREGLWLDVLMCYNVVTGATMAFRKEFREIALPIPELRNTIHDGWIALVIGAFAKLAFINEPLVLYRQHGGQQLGIRQNPSETNVAPHTRPDYRCVARYYAAEIERLSDIAKLFIELKKRISSGLYDGNVANDAQLGDHIARLQDIMIHYRLRGQLSPKRLQRLGPIARELLTRRYHRYSKGTLSAIKDLVRDAST